MTKKRKKNGKDLELVVELIQKSIEPDAEIIQNAQLPVLTSPSKRTRQCDIVILSGPSFRRTKTIVEVQDRSSQVDINNFNGWLLKLEEIGAQHLICVSRQEFPESIVEKTLQLGNKVKLITLKEANPVEIPQSFFKSGLKYINFQINNYVTINITYSKEDEKSLGINELIKSQLDSKNLNSDDKLFSLDKRELKSIYKLCQESIENLDNPDSGINTIKFDRLKGQPLFLHINGIFTRIGLTVTFNWKNEVHVFPVSILKYEQLGDGSLAWIFEANATIKGKPISIKMPFIKENDRFHVKGLVGDLDSNHDVSFQITKETDN
jgi:hypothetical protein